MRLEVALLEWGDGLGGSGVRLVGRSSDASVVETVRRHLSDQVELAGNEGSGRELRLVVPGGNDAE